MRVFALILCFFQAIGLNAQSQKDLIYTLEWGNESEHTFYISLEVAPEKGKTTRFQIPAWRPGRYILQNYAVAVSHFSATDANGNSLVWQKSDKDSWLVQNPKKGRIKIQYRYYANTLDAGSSYLGDDLYYFNGINLFMYIPGQQNRPCTLHIPGLENPELKIATALPKTNIRTQFIAEDYHQLADCPVIISSKIHTLTFTIQGKLFYLHFQGKYRGNSETDQWLVQASETLFKEQAAIFGSFPFREYHALYLLNPLRIRHAVEHANSSCYTLPEEVTSTIDAMKYGILGITSHEFWHVWNVKRIRPAALTPYRYDTEIYTRLHWFTEGVTSYMEELTLLRAGLRTELEFYTHLAKTATSLDNSYASGIISPADASFDTWLSATRLGNPEHRISFYSLGERAGFMLDLYLRSITCGQKGLDDVFLQLEKDYGSKGIGYPENAIENICEKITGKSCLPFFNKYIYGTEKFPYQEFLSSMGLILEKQPDASATWEKTGIVSTKELAGQMIRIQVKPESDAMRAGLGNEDLILTAFNKPITEIDPQNFVNLKPGDKIPVTCNSMGRTFLAEIIYTGSDDPVIYTISTDPDAEPESVILRENWLQSKR